MSFWFVVEGELGCLYIKKREKEDRGDKIEVYTMVPRTLNKKKVHNSGKFWKV